MAHPAIFVCVTLWQNEISEKTTRKDQEKQNFNQEKLNSPYCNLPVHTRDTAGTGSGMPRYAKVDYRTRTRVTRFGKPAGFPVPVANPKEW